jgi:hypothetical protein
MSAPVPAAGPSAVIDEITALGAFFVVDRWRDTTATDTEEDGWQPMGPAEVAARVTAVREWLARASKQQVRAIEVRVAASVAHLGLTVRLVSPAVAAAALHGRPLLFALDDVRWQPVLGGPVPLSLPAAALGEPSTGPEALADLLAERLLGGPVEELGAAFGEFGVSPHILRGNTASAVNGAVAALAQTRPEPARRVQEFADLLLARPPLAGESTRTSDGAFRRRSCCLIYRAAPGGRGALCGDCVLR